MRKYFRYVKTDKILLLYLHYNIQYLPTTQIFSRHPLDVNFLYNVFTNNKFFLYKRLESAIM